MSAVVLDADEYDPDFVMLLESAAALQERIPDTVLVGGSAAAVYAKHRYSTDHDHVLVDLSERYDTVLEAVEASDGWVTSTRGKPPMTILGMEAGYEAGIRQLRRKRPIEVTVLELPTGGQIRIPTQDEMLRIKAYLIVNRNQMRDYLDVAALADQVGISRAGRILAVIDDYYDESTSNGAAVSTVLAERLAVAQPRDHKAIRSLARYKGLDKRWAVWANIQAVCSKLAFEMVKL